MLHGLGLLIPHPSKNILDQWLLCCAALWSFASMYHSNDGLSQKDNKLTRIDLRIILENSNEGCSYYIFPTWAQSSTLGVVEKFIYMQDLVPINIWELWTVIEMVLFNISLQVFWPLVEMKSCCVAALVGLERILHNT